MNHLEKWSTNESLLQSYRQIFIASQSFFLAIGAILVEKTDKQVIISLSCVALLMIWYIWFRIVRTRHLAVDYHKYLHEYISNNNGQKPDNICTELEYIEICSDKRRETNQILGIDRNLRLTRFKIDLLLPILFTLTWGLLIYHKMQLINT